MCGIVGYIGPRNAAQIIMDGLRRLEYRGYDSAGIAVIQNGQIAIRRDVGKLSNLSARLADAPIEGNIGIGHTRWATHGKPSERNAHPHMDFSGQLVVVQNGIVENFRDLRAELEAEGIAFQSETDTEVIAHLVGLHYQGDRSLVEAVRLALAQLRGPSAVVVLSQREPETLVAARLGNAGGVAVGLGDGEMFVASDMPAILEHTRRMVFLENRQVAVVTRASAAFSTLEGQSLRPHIHTIPWDPISAAKGEYKHFMQKEIYEQANSLTDTIRGRVDLGAGEVFLEQVTLTAERARALTQIVSVACGTSYHSELVGAFMFEQLARLPVRVEYASEFRYRDPVLDRNTLMLAITQSGETVDTLAAMEEGRGKGAHLATIVNVIGSQASRVSDSVIYMHTGPEIGVASTKAFTASLVDQYLLAVCLGSLRGLLSAEARQALLDDLAGLPALVGHLLDPATHKLYEDLAQRFFQYTNFLYLGRGVNYPIALEGALKLKEISYIHAEGYAAGEMKHGPIALIDEHMPVVAICPQD
ncbi:MAG: glutamine--fructose-6-phosphate transaminase (isomerizing), partial [Anaerolineae bacterium]|nr:glutamine--fructose-6-phosphate transaminase (isomerizing) [Anaerolineae bacterium]